MGRTDREWTGEPGVRDERDDEIEGRGRTRADVRSPGSERVAHPADRDPGTRLCGPLPGPADVGPGRDPARRIHGRRDPGAPAHRRTAGRPGGVRDPRMAGDLSPRAAPARPSSASRPELWCGSY